MVVLQKVCTDKMLDLIALLAKFYIYKRKWQETAPSLKFFLRILKARYTADRFCIIITRDKLHDFDPQRLPCPRGIDHLNMT